jgi:RES domain-containing protein
VTYAGEHAATAQLEWLAHLNVSRLEDAPPKIPFSEIDVPDDLASREIEESNLPDDWRINLAVTQRLGDAWLDGRSTALLFVPSAIAPARNLLLNPTHPGAAQMRVLRAFDYPFDGRILKGI